MIIINDNLLAFWYVHMPKSGMDWRMALLRLRGGVPQITWRLRNYKNPLADGGPNHSFDWYVKTGKRGDSVKVGLFTCQDWAREVARRERAELFEAVRGTFEPTEQLAARIQRDLFIDEAALARMKCADPMLDLSCLADTAVDTHAPPLPVHGNRQAPLRCPRSGRFTR